MSVKEQKEGVCISSERRIPSTTAVQFPDNIERPFWSLKDTASASDDFFDCYVSFKELGCHEYFWEWQDRKLDALLVKKLVHAYGPFFRDNPIGKDRFITFTIKNKSSVETLGRLYMSIITSNDFAAGNKFFSPPVFEVVHSAKTSDDLVHFSQLYNETVSMATDKLGHDCGPKVLSVIPKHNFDSKWYSGINKYFNSFQSSFRCRLDYFRPLIPRSAVADKLGFVGSVLATKRALSSYTSFSKIAQIPAHPIIEAGPLMFRGGLNPDQSRNFLETYPGARTVTITPAFRYGYDLDAAKRSISELNRTLPRNKPVVFSQEELKRMLLVENVFARNYRRAVRRLPDLNDIVKEVDSINRSIDSRLGLSFSLYSLGIPPELLGTGKAILECIKEGLVKDLEKFYPNIKHDLFVAGCLLNKENLKFLSKTHKAWNEMMNEVNLIEDYTDLSLGPNSTETFLHRNHTSNVFHLRSVCDEFSKDLQAAARLRHCVG